MTPNQDPRLIYYGQVHYIPSLELCIVALICYLTSTLTNLSSLLRFKPPSALPLFLGCLLELLGYVLRTCSAVSAFDHDVSRSNTSDTSIGSARGGATSAKLYIAQLTLLLLAPLSFTSTLYLCIARLATLYGTLPLSLPFLRKSRLFPSLFLALDALTALLFLPGAAVLASASRTSNPDSGKMTADEIFLATLVFQSMVLAGFASLTLHFLFKTKGSTIWTRRRGFRVILLLALGGIYLRTLFRMAECATATATVGKRQTGSRVLSREAFRIETGPV
ncbi:hypothetical protein NU195Hw_g2589t1 [Hortaea werneckii]